MSDTAFVRREESDPNGIGQHAPGAKLDAGKVRVGLVLFGFARALEQVARVGTYGAEHYSDNGWMQVPDGVRRYTDAMLRHLLAEAMGERIDPATGLPHAAHGAWNALARLDLMLRERPACRDRELVESEKDEPLLALVRATNQTVADCCALLDRRAATPELNRGKALDKLLELAKEIQNAGFMP